MHPVLFSLGPVTIYSFGVFAFIAFIAASFVVWKRGLESHFSEEDVFDTLVVATFLGILGARALYIVLHFDRFGFNFLRFIAFVKVPGFSFLGGAAAGVLALWLMAERKRWDFFAASDVAVTGLSLAQAIGYLGAFFAGFAVGRESSVLGVKFVGYDNPRLPVQILWSIGLFLIFYFLYRVEERYRTFDWYRGKRSAAQDGFLTFSYLIFYGLLLFLLSFFIDVSLYLAGIPIEYFTALVFLISGIVGLYWRSGRRLKNDLELIWESINEGIRKTGKLVRNKK